MRNASGLALPERFPSPRLGVGKSMSFVTGCTWLKFSLHWAGGKGGKGLANDTDALYSYCGLIDFLENVFLHLLYALRTISRDLNVCGVFKIYFFTSYSCFTRENEAPHNTILDILSLISFHKKIMIALGNWISLLNCFRTTSQLRPQWGFL